MKQVVFTNEGKSSAQSKTPERNPGMFEFWVAESSGHFDVLFLLSPTPLVRAPPSPVESCDMLNMSSQGRDPILMYAFLILYS